MKAEYLLKSLVLLPLLSSGCQSYYFDFTEGMTVKATSVTTAVYNTTPTDVLFVIDNSGTMAEEQNELINSTEKFINTMAESPNDFRIGIITTDTIHYTDNQLNDRDSCCMHIECNTAADCRDTTKLFEPRETDLCVQNHCLAVCKTDKDCLPGETCTYKPENSENTYCEVVQECDKLTQLPNYCDHGHLRGPGGMPFATENGQGLWYMGRPNNDEEKAKLINDFKNTIKSLGVRGTTFEAGLDAMVLAVKNGANNGFPRPEADLAVIFLSDENDCSLNYDTAYKTMTQEDCYDQTNSTYKLKELSFYLAELAQIKGDISKVRAAGIFGVMPWSINDVNRPQPALGYYASGCYKIPSSGASNDCCCLSGMVDNMANPHEDFYCQMLANEPYSQSKCSNANPRIPDLNKDGLGGCSAMPGNRYLEFLELLANNREQEGLDADTLVDSICSAGYQETLIKIVNSVILNDCFTLEKQPSDGANSLLVYLNGEKLNYIPTGEEGKGWRYQAKSNKLCLTGGLHKNLNDEFNITIITGSSSDTDK